MEACKTTIRVITNLPEMADIRSDWERLFASSIKPTVFGTWAWQYQCAKYLADGQNLAVIAVYRDGTLVAVLPMRWTKTRLAGVIPTRLLKCLGGLITDYNAFVVRQGYLSAAVRGVADYFRRRRIVLDMENVLPGTALHVLIKYLKKNRFRTIAHGSKIALGARLGSDYERFMAGLKKKFRRNIRQNQNYMDRVGGYSYHTEKADDTLLDMLVRLHTSRWAYKGESGALASDKIRIFHSELQKTPDRPFEIRYYTIRHHDTIAAILYGFVFRNCYYAYLSGLDMAHNRVSPGNMVFHSAIHDLMQSGITGFDMLRGDMSYKQSWATHSYDMQDTVVFPPGISGWLRFLPAKTTRMIKDAIPGPVKKGLKSLWGTLTPKHSRG